MGAPARARTLDVQVALTTEHVSTSFLPYGGITYFINSNIYRLLHRKCNVWIFIHEFSKVLQRLKKNLYKALSML